MVAVCKLASDEHAGAFRADRLVVGVSVGYGENLSRSVDGSLAVLRDDEGAGQNEAANGEGMAVLSFWRSRFEVLRFYFGVAIGPEFCLEVDLIHVIFPPPSVP